jgi:hypothetical protein
VIKEYKCEKSKQPAPIQYKFEKTPVFFKLIQTIYEAFLILIKGGNFPSVSKQQLSASISYDTLLAEKCKPC